jgi:hypothetical protein
VSVVVVPLHAHYSRAHLVHVTDEMRRRGAPVIRAYRDDETGAWLTFEGTHRLRAALSLGVAPVMRPSPWPRSAEALRRARFAAVERGHLFPAVEVQR